MRARSHAPTAPRAAFAPPPRAPLVQRACVCGSTPGPDGECAACRAARLRGDERNRVQGPAVGVPPAVQEALGSPGRALEPSVRARMEPLFGHDFSQVRVHADAKAAESARAVDALAYTVGRDIVLGGGRPAPDTEGHVLAHELAHVVQQRGAVHDGGPIALASASDAAEREAEAAARAAVRGERPALSGPLSPGAAGHVIQRMLACPPRLTESDPTPPGWRPYYGDPTVFHCGFRGILEDRAPTPADPQNECFYDHSGALVDETHPYAGCRGTPNLYASERDPIRHALIDPGGIARAGAPAFVTSRVYQVSSSIAAAIEVVAAAGGAIRSIAEGFADLVALGVLTGVAAVEPGNWRFQGLPARSVQHLNVVGTVLTSAALAGNVDTMLRNLTRRLDSFPSAGLIDEIAADINQARDARGRPGAPPVVAAELGALSLVQLVELLRTEDLLQHVRPPEEIARERLMAERAASSPADAPSGR